MSGTFSTLFIMRIFGAGLSFLSFALLGRLLGADGLGAYAFAMSWLTLAQLVTTLGLHHYAVRAVPPMRVGGDVAGLRGFLWLSAALCSGLSLGLILLAPGILEAVQVSPEPPLQDALLVASILLLPLTLSQLRSGLLRGFGRPVEAMAPELVLVPALQLLIFVTLWRAGQNVSVELAIRIVFGVALVALLVGFWPLWRALRDLPKAQPRFHTGKWLIEGGKSSVLFAVGALMATTDVVMLGALSSAGETGIYAVAARFFALMQIAALVASGAVSHLVAEYVAARKNAELADLAERTATRTIQFALVMAVIATGPALAAGLIFGPQFAAATTPILVMIWFRAAEAIFGHPASFLANGGRIGLAALVAAGGVLLNAMLNLVLIPSFGALGAAVATSLAHLITTLATAWGVWKVFGIKSVPSVLQAKKETT